MHVKYLFNADRHYFLETDKIDGMFIHEYILGSEIKYCLAFIVKGNNKLCLFCKHLYPLSLHILKKIYRKCKQNL